MNSIYQLQNIRWTIGSFNHFYCSERQQASDCQNNPLELSGLPELLLLRIFQRFNNGMAFWHILIWRCISQTEAWTKWPTICKVMKYILLKNYFIWISLKLVQKCPVYNESTLVCPATSNQEAINWTNDDLFHGLHWLKGRERINPWCCNGDVIVLGQHLFNAGLLSDGTKPLPEPN